MEAHEGGLLALMGALVATLMCAYTVAKVLRDALFIAEFGALSLPYAYIGVALASAGFVWLESVVASRLSHAGATRFHQYTAIAFACLAALLLPLSRHWTIVWFYLWTGSQAMMLLPQFWGLALNVWDSQRARRVFPALAGFGLLGGLAGGALAAWSGSILQRVGLMWVIAGLLGVGHLLTLLVERSRALLPAPPEARSTDSRWEIIRKSRYIQIFALALALSVIVGTLIDFQFKYYIQHLYSDPRTLTQFLGRFYMALNLAALLFQFGAAGWLMRSLGLGAASGLQPASILLLSAWVTLSPIWWAVLSLRAVQGVVSQSLGKSSTEIYYAAIRPCERRQIKAAIDTLVERWSDALVGAVLIVLLKLLRVPVQAIAVGTGVLAALWILFNYFLNREFGAAFKLALSSRWLDAEEAPDSLQLAPARAMVLKGLRSGDEPHIVISLRLIQSSGDPRIAAAVRDCLRHPSPAVRLAAVQALEAMRLRDRDGLLEAFLNDPDEKLRRATVGHRIAVGPDSAGFARGLLHGSDAALRQYAVDALFDRPLAAPGVLTLPWIDARLESGSRDECLLAARALGALQGREPAIRLRELLSNTDLEIQREALRSAARRPSATLSAALVALLPVTALAGEARIALAAQRDAAVPGLLGVLDGGSGPRAQDLAARTLSRIATPRAIAALMTLVRGGDVRRRHLGIQALARMRARTGRAVLSRAVTHRLFLRELLDFRRSEEAALAMERHAVPGIRLLGESYRESADMALERAFQALACWYEPRPLLGVLERLMAPGQPSSAPALEFLGHVMPRKLFKVVRRTFELPPARPMEPTPGDEPLGARILRAWESEDDWLRACAVRAAREIPDFDFSRLSAGQPATAMVQAELDELAPAAPSHIPANLRGATC